MSSIKTIEISERQGDYWLHVTGIYSGHSLNSSSFRWKENNRIEIYLDIKPYPKGKVHSAVMHKFSQWYNIKRPPAGIYQVYLDKSSKKFKI